MRSRVFQIGFNRCGTTALARFFERTGLRTAHWERGTVAAYIELARREGRLLLDDLDRFDAFTDMEAVKIHRLGDGWLVPRRIRRLRRVVGPNPRPIYAFKYFRELDAQYPGSKFVLNTRDVDRWVESRLAFKRERPYRACPHGLGVHATEGELVDCWRQEWDAHHREVREHFGTRRDLLVFDIERDDPEALCAFLAPLAAEARHWSRANAR